jgi:hypothetical protein
MSRDEPARSDRAVDDRKLGRRNTPNSTVVLRTTLYM